ncbi:hypothetical protein TL16_g03518 [Triparma laevis f. inornata]|uniref:Glucosyltransferase 24 catalytic domain-containing protein n=1 Tax=Triparma laevis f. inornata TaxID=1714386 RepID=A0A9W7E1A9_9STRA|nr:hypothetical protein TL16_g03518 [Triparma laevis f. inornata]
MSICNLFSHHFNVKVFYTPKLQYAKYTSYSVPVNRYYGLKNLEGVEGLTSLEIDYSDGSDVRRSGGDKDVDSIRCGKECEIEVEYIVKGIVIHGQAYYSNKTAAKGLQISIYDERDEFIGDTRVMDNLGYWQLKVMKSGEYRIKGKGVEEVIKVEGLGGEYVFLNVAEGEEIASFQQDAVVEEEGSELETINIFSVCTGHLYERFMKIMMLSVTQSTIQRKIWGYKILFLDVLFPQGLDRIIFVDADQVFREDIRELWDLNLEEHVYGYVPFCDSNKDTLGFQFWREGYWKDLLGDKPYHISALYLVDLNKFRDDGVGDILRATYESLSRDPGSLSNLDQDLPNFVSPQVPIFSLPQEWLWCESWCSLDTKVESKTIDLCNNPLKKEPKIDMARRIIKGELFEKSWEDMDEEVKLRIGGEEIEERHDEL